MLDESEQGTLFYKMPWVHLIPVEKLKKPVKHIYQNPLYKTSERKGTLSTTGHSTNFVMTIDCPIPQDKNEDYYIKRGVALLTTLDDE